MSIADRRGDNGWSIDRAWRVFFSSRLYRYFPPSMDRFPVSVYKQRGKAGSIPPQASISPKRPGARDGSGYIFRTAPVFQGLLYRSARNLPSFPGLLILSLSRYLFKIFAEQIVGSPSMH